MQNSCTSCDQRLDSGFAARLGSFLRAPISAVSNGLDTMKMTALGAWAADELGRQGAESVEILWTHQNPAVEVSASFSGEGVFTVRSDDEQRRDKAVMSAVSQIIDDRVEAYNFSRLRGGDMEGEPWWHVLGIAPDANMAAVKVAYRAKARLMHPDHGGSHAAMARLNKAKVAADRVVVH